MVYTFYCSSRPDFKMYFPKDQKVSVDHDMLQWRLRLWSAPKTFTLQINCAVWTAFIKGFLRNIFKHHISICQQRGSPIYLILRQRMFSKTAWMKCREKCFILAKMNSDTTQFFNSVEKIRLSIKVPTYVCTDRASVVLEHS